MYVFFCDMWSVAFKEVCACENIKIVISRYISWRYFSFVTINFH